jgi:hypothetical protein
MNNSEKNKDSQKISFEAKFASSIKLLYSAILVFLILLITVVYLKVIMTFIEKIIFLILFITILIVFIYILFRANKIKYIIDSNNLKILGPIGDRHIYIKEIKTIKKTVIPTGIRLFGASFLGGWYYIPGVGKTWIAMSNFRDGVLITTKDKLNIVVTPKNPYKFIDIIERNQKK